MDQRTPGISPAGSMSSLSGSFSPRDSPGPMSPGIGAERSFTDRAKKSGGGGIQMQIQQLQDEQERVQKKTFTNWMNTYLKQKSPPMKVENLFEDIKDGVVLLSLLEVLSGEKLPMERGKLKRVHYVSNLSTALKFLESKKIKLVNINVSDIADGKASIVLGLIWTIILYFQIEETMVAQQSQDTEGEARPLSALDKFRMNAKKALLAWTENAITKRYGIEIRDFGKSWRDGLAFNAIVHTIRPDLVDMEQVKKQSARLNLENAFSTAENHLGIARLLDPEDVDVAKPDEKSVMTYVAQFLKAYPEAGEDPALRKKIKTPAEQEMADYNDLMAWCTTEAEEVLQIVEQPVTDRQQEYMDYLAFKAEVDRRGNVYNKLEEKVKSGKSVKINAEQFQPLEEAWKKVVRNTRLWLWKLDASLPGRLGKFGDWLNQAEEMLEQEEDMLENPEEMAAQLGNILQEHKKFFKDLDSNKQFFMQVKRAGRYEGEFLPGPQIDNLHQRLQVVCKQAPQRERRLEFEEMKYQLLAYLVASENKLKIWTVKYGRQDSVEGLLEDYNEFVHRGNLFKNYDKTYEACKRNSDAYRKANIPKEEVEKMNTYFDEVNGRWKKVSVEIKSVQSMLEEVIDCWKKYNACVDIMTAWLNDGEAVMSQSTEQKQQFFSDLPQFEEKHRILNESGNFLIETVEEPVAAEIKQTLLMVNRRFKDLVDGYQTFKQVEVVGKARKEYGEGLSRLSMWLKNAEELLVREVPCSHKVLKEYLNELDTFTNQIPTIENDFKVTTKTAQSLVKESSQEVVTEMLQSLNIQKEVLVRLRKEIPEKTKYLKALLPNVESLETGLVDMNDWLDKGEALLESNKLDGTQEEAEMRLEKHRAFFSEITYQKSIIESKNKVHQKVSTAKPKLKNVDFSVVDVPIEEMNKRFQICVAKAKEWEKKLDNLSRLWRVLNQKQHTLEAWLDQAQANLEDTEDDYDSLIRKHKSFFVRVDERMLQDYVRACQDILMVLEEEDRAPLKESMENIQQRWEQIQKIAPVKLIKLEFCVQEEKFMGMVENAEKTINQQQQKLQRRENVKETLQKHKQMFHQGDFQKTCVKCLESMDNLSKDLLRQDSRDSTLREQYEIHRERWAKLKDAIDGTLLSLKQLPERWKEYNAKLGEFTKFVETVEDLGKKLQREDLTTEEYKDLQAQFQRAVKNMNKFKDDSKWLKDNLEELLQDSDDTNAQQERKTLENMLGRFNNLMPSMDRTSDKSAVFSKAYDFRDGIDRRVSWLDDAQKQVMDEPFIDGLEDARTCLHEHESLMSRLEKERDAIMRELEEGKRLQKEKNAPTFIKQKMADLERKLKDTNQLAEAKHTKLKNKVKDWEQYEGEKTNMLQYLKQAEAELEKPLATTGQELAQKDYSSKKELQQTLSKLKGSLNEVQKLNAILCEGASRERRGPLKGEMTDIDKRLENVSVRLNAKLSDLEATIAKWTEYYKRLTHFCDWLNEKEEKLNSVYEDKSSTPEEQLEHAKAIATEVYENHITLENLEKDARGLSQNFRSRETAALKSKLATLRRQWESLCARAKDRSSALTGSVAHWQMYQNLATELMPWVLKAEKYCATELPKCSSMQEAKDMFDIHQQFLHECETNLPIFEKMTTEAGFIIDQPNMQKELENLQRRWGDIITVSEERSHRVDKMQGAWVAYNQEANNIDEILEKFEHRLAQEPNVNSTDPQVLEHEVALCKTLQEEIRSQQPHLNALQRQFEQVKQHATPEGVQDLKSRQNAVKVKWEKVSADAAERQNMLNAALRHRQDFYGRLNEFEKWVKKTQRKLDSGAEIYSDEVGETMQKLKALKRECEESEPEFNALAEEFKELVRNCNEDEAAILTDRYDRIMGGYSKIDDLLKNREQLCEEWEDYQNTHRDTQGRLKTLQAKLASPNITEEEVAEINEEVKALRKDMNDWKKKADPLDELMASAQLTIKDRATQKTLHFGTELQALDSMCDSVLFNSHQKQEHLGELAQLWNEFENRQAELVDKLGNVGDKIDTLTVKDSSLQGIKDLVRDIEDVRDEVFTINPEYEQLRELGRQIMQADPSKASSVQASLGEINKAWDGVQGQLGDKLNHYTAVGNAWQQYNDLKQGVVRTLDDVDPLVESDIAFKSQPDVKKSLDQHKNAEFELHANQSQLDQMNHKGLQLLEELRNLPNFDQSILEHDLDNINHRWETSNAKIDEHKQNLEAQLNCWDQVQTGKEEMESWVNSMVTKLDDSLQHFDDAVTVESCLMKFKEESPVYEEILNEMAQKISDLKEMNRDEEIPELEAEYKQLKGQFDKAKSLANQLEGVMANFTDERENLQKEIEAESEWLNAMKDKLGKCDDVSGTDEDLVKRLQNCKELEEEMKQHQGNIAALLDKTSAMQARFPSAETANLAKDAVVLNKKFESVLNRGEKTEDLLQSTLEQHCNDAQMQQQRWLNAAKEKVAWCDDIAGDRYSVEAKLGTIKDLINSAGEGETKKATAKAKIKALMAVLPKKKQGELGQQEEVMEAEWTQLLNSMQNTENKLESSIDQWQAYDKEYDNLSHWLKDMEGRVRNESSLKPDLQGKAHQYQQLKELQAEVLKHQPDFETVKDSAQGISKSTGDGRTASYANQLYSRYQTLAASIQEQVEKCGQNVADHEEFQTNYKDCIEWIEAKNQELVECSEMPSDNEALETKLDSLNTLNSTTDSGLGTFNSALESGERLYPNTSNEGRESIRRELRSLRDKWENYNDNLNETQRKLESSRMQWSSFDENFDQLEKWLNDTNKQLKEDAEPNNTLQEKKASLQHYRTRCQDIVSHQTMIDSLSDKGSALASTKVKGKLNQLNAKYNALCQAAQAQVKKAESEVDQHQKFQDSYQQCRDWMATTKDKLAVCAEASGDRQALQNRLDKVQDLVKSMRDGQSKVKVVHVNGEKTIPQTGPQGQKAIRQDLEGLTEDWEALASRMDETQENLMHALQALTAYDGSCDQLNKWLRETETAIKEVDLKCTLGDKQGQVEKLKDLQQQVNARQRHFDELQDMVSHMQGADSRLVNYSGQLNSRYETLKSNLRDLINRWQDYVREHQGYSTGYSECKEWVDTLNRRLEVCGDMAGDKQDVEDRLTKLQELQAEKEQGAAKIHLTVESGEKLYPSTAAEGREIIRQELRSLRDQWEQVCDQLSDTQRKLESCLIQWSSYDENYEQLQKWLLDTEVQLNEDTDMKATLPDKKAQLQNHRVLHQDIMSRQHVLDNLMEKAQTLSASSPVAKVNKFVDEAHTKYGKLCNQSKQMLEKLEAAVKDHQQYQDAYQDCQDWLNASRDKVEACADTSGDRVSIQNKLERLKLEATVKDHQQYQDAYQDCQDWLNASRDKVEACADTSGDRVSIQNKLERLKEFASRVPEGEKKLRLTQEHCHKTSQNSSIPGREVLRREMDHLQSEWQDYVARIQQAEEDLEHAQLQWGDFETKFDACSHWLKNMEQQVKNYELKSTLPEKKAQVEKFKKQREEILSHQPDFDRFTDDAQNLMHTSADVRLSTQVSQLTNRYRGLLTQIKDLISKWEKYVQDHATFDSRYSEFRNWLTQAEEKLEGSQQPSADQDTMEEKKAVIQMLLSEKDHGLQKLNLALEAGERLYPDTAAAGREKVRQSLRNAKEDWERLFNTLNDTQRRVDNFLLQWTSYAEGQDQLMRWMTDTEATLRGDVDMKNTLQEKRMQLQNQRSLLQDVASHQRLVDSVIEKAQGVLQSTSNPNVANFITEVNSRYEGLAQGAKAQIMKSDKAVKDHQDHHDALQAAVDWLTLMKDRLSTCADTAGDRHTLQNKLDRVKELMSALPEGEAKVRACEEHSEVAMETTALKGRQAIQQELDVLKLDWEDYSVKLSSLQDSLEKAVQHWGQYEDQYGIISQWVKDMERRIKDFPLKSTLEEKQDQLKKYQDLMSEIKSRQREVDVFSDESQTLQQLTGEGRLTSSISQLTARYQSLQQSVKDILKKCDQNVTDHKTYKDKARECSQWLNRAKERFANNADTSGTRQELEERLERIQELISERDTGFAKLNQVIEAGEKLYPNTATDGREKVRQELRQYKLTWESLFDDLSSAQRKLEVALVQWTTFDDSYGQVEQWLRDAEVQLEGAIPLRSTLEEKKSQLQNFKVLHQDVLSYQRVIDSVDDKARTLVQTSSDPQLSNFVSQTGARYSKLCDAAKERVTQYEGYVADHQQYNDAYNQCVEWLNSIREKLSLCADIAGDRHTIQNRLDKIQDILATKMEGEPKVKNIVALAEKVLPNTAPQGKDSIVRETEALRADWEAFMTALQKTKKDLENCMDQWKEFDSWYERCNSWLKDVEAKVKDTELKATLKDKQNQLDKLKKLQEELNTRQGDIDALSDAAQDLVRISTDTRVISQSSQLATKYQTLRVNIKELCRRWEQYVLDHQAYVSSFDQCKNWVGGMRKKLQSQSDVKGDKRTVQERIQKIQDLMADKEEGMHMLQIALDNLQIVLPNTNVAGRDNMRREMQTLQAEYDALSADLNETRNKLDGTLSQWTVYDDSVEQLRRWLNDLENQIHTETQLQNTLQEKKLQLERVKVLQLNIGSQRSTIDNLNEKAQTLQQSSSDPNLTGQIKQIVDKYSRLCDSAKDLQTDCEKRLKNHQHYRDVYMETSEWLAATVDKMNSCSDVRGDRTTIEAQLQKVCDIQGTLEAGRQKLDDTLSRGDAVLPETSKQGQDLIREELNILTNDFEQFDTDINELQVTLEKLRDEWYTYEEEYDRLNQWIKDTESEIKSDSELKATLEEKSMQLEKQETFHEEVTTKQAEFDSLTEHAQILLQSTTDNRVTSQLTQMSSRYTSLISTSKDFLKRYHQHVEDHQQYAETFTEAVTWLQGTRDKLSVCADTSGDKYTIQSQLEKLQEFSVMKEEGQLLIHTAQSWGEKTMNNTSVDGREMIRQELQQLQQEWETMIGEVTDTKVMLESCLLQWTDFNDSYEQIQKRLKEMEKRLRGADTKADLGEKKAELQRVKGIYQDVISFEQMVESAGIKAQDLMQKSPASKASTDTSQIINKYHQLKDLAMEMLAKSEVNVAQHQAYHDSCNNFVSWLRTAREKLATCSDTFGEKSAIVSKIERARALVEGLNEGAQRLAEATKSGEATLPNTSPTGQTKIRQELKAMNKDFEEFRTELMSAQEDLEECLSRWTEFEDSYSEFNNWLKKTETFLRSDLEMKTTLEEKKNHWEHYQHFMEEIQYKQANLDHVNEKAQSLLQTNADAKTSHAITQLTTRYQGVIALSKDIVKNLTAYYNNHLHYKDSFKEFNTWISETKLRLQNIHRTAGSKEDIGTKLENMAELQTALDMGHELLKQLLVCSEKTLPNTSSRGAQNIKQECDNAKSQYENLLTDMSQAKRGLESALNQWGDFDRSHEQFHVWLTAMEAKVNADPGFKTDLPEKRSALEKFKALYADCLGHRELLERLEEKASNVNDAHPQSRVLDLRSRYSAVTTAIKELVSKLDSQASSHEEYRKAYIGCLDWMANTRHRLQRLSDFSGDRRTLQDRLQQIKDFKGEMRHGQDMVNNATQMGERVCLTTAPRGQDAIHKEIQTLKDDWSSFAGAVNEVEQNLEACVGNWVDLEDELSGFTHWMENMERKMKALNDSKSDSSRKEKHLREAEDLLEEIVKKKSALELVREKGEAVAQRSTDPRLNNNLMQLATKYQSLTSAAKNLVSTLAENAEDHKAYNDAFHEATKWLASMQERVLECNDTAGDWHSLQDRMDAIKNITANMDEGLFKVNKVCDLAEKILPNTSSEGKRLIEQQVTELTNEWEKLNMSITDCNAMLEGVQERWNDYEEYYGSLVKWLAEMENTLGMDPEPKAQLVEKKTQLDKYKLMMGDIDNHQRLVNELAERVANLEALSENPEVAESLQDVQNRYDRVRQRCRVGVNVNELAERVANLEALSENPEVAESLQDVQNRYDRVRQRSRVSVNVNELAERVANLEALSENPEVAESLQDVQNRYDRVRQRCRELVSKLDRNYQEHLGFHEAQQESEKWLLQTSFRLMNHNSLNCSTMELTQRQIDKHRMLLREIEEYRSVLDRVNMKGRRLIDNNPRTPRLAEQMQGQLQNLEESYINLQATAEQIRDRLQDVLKRWQEYRGHLDSTDRFLKEEFPHWLKDTDSDVPDSKADAQRKLDGVKGMHERLSTMKQDIDTCAERCENLGSVENLEENDLPTNTPIYKLAATVNEDLQQATDEVDQRLNQIRENMQQWDNVDRMRGELRTWLHDMQEEVEEMEKQPSKLHAEACEVDIAKLQTIREEVQARGPAVEGLLARYRELTQHNPNLQDPVIKAVKDDWEELLGQVENLIEDREHALQQARELQARENEMDDDLENYINELEKIESAATATVEKSAMLKTRKPCRSTQTPRGSAKNPNRSFLTGDFSDDDNDDDDKFLFPPRPRPGSRGSSSNSLKRKRPSGPRSPSRTSRPGSRPGSRFDHLKKHSGGATLESESEESGYGETYYTMHASSFDNHLDDTEVFEQEPTLNTMRGTPLALENHFSDGESTVSYLSTQAFGGNPDDLRDATSQTPGHTSTQTPAGNWGRNKPRTMQTQTAASNMSLHSIGNQTRRSSGSRADLLRSILFEVKGMKQQRGLDSSFTGSEDDANSVRSENTIKKETLQTVLEDVRTLREADATGTAATQTVQEEGTQTSLKLFPEGDPVRNARLEKFRNIMDDVKGMQGSRAGTPSAGSRSRPSSRTETPVNKRHHRGTPARFADTMPVQNGYTHHPPMYPQQNLNATAPAMMMQAPMMQPAQPVQIAGRRMVSQDDLNSISQRLERLQSFVPPRRPPPPPRPEYVIPVYAAPPRRGRPQEDAYLSDESEYGDIEPPRRRRIRSTLEDALEEANRSALQLKRLSKRMKNSLRDDMQYDFL